MKDRVNVMSKGCKKDGSKWVNEWKRERMRECFGGKQGIKEVTVLLRKSCLEAHFSLLYPSTEDS